MRWKSSQTSCLGRSFFNVRLTGEVLKSQYELRSSELVEKETEEYEGYYNQSKI